ncbi:MAG: right-handed parallel beta-helix repeat-containing protein, partial [Bacteroidales bacterium]|nr:right-handed parallel beta-helix repeat-containing protein [Bacteroidales bacterium]
MRKLYLMFLLALVSWFMPGQKASAQYCQPSFTYGCTSGDGFTYFGLGTINQTITCAAYVNDFTSQSTLVVPGIAQTISIIAGYSNTYMIVWVDLNNNQTFESTEALSTGLCSAAGTTYTFSLTVPAGTPGGPKRMRVLGNWNSAPATTGACASYSYGNSSDFTLMVASSDPCDLMAQSWDEPFLSSSDLTTAETVKVSVYNMGSAAQSGFSVAYSIDGGLNYVTELVSATVQPYTTYQHTFSATANLAAAGAYDVMVKVELACDTVSVANNTYSAVLTNTLSVNSYPFFANFEGATGYMGWAAGGTSSSWEWGVPTASLINSAYSPTNVWATNLDGNYNSNESSWVTSPFFNFTSLTAPIVEFKMWTNIETGYYDGLCLQYTIDGGATWHHVGIDFGTPSLDPNGENWYNATAVAGLAYMNGWNGSNGGWQTYKYKLYDNTGFYTNLVGQSSVKFRFWFGSNASTVYNGVAFDDFQVYQAPNNDIGAIALPTLSVVCAGSVQVDAIIKNYGFLTLNTATVGWSVNGVTQTPITYTGPLAANASATVVLGNYNFQNGIPYNVDVWTSMPNGVADEIPFNDTFSVTNFQTSLSGVYTIGATGYFPTLTAARNALVTYGVCGPVEFQIQSGTYNEQISIPQITGASAINTITFGSLAAHQDSVVIQFATNSTNNWVWKLDGADYVTLKNVTLKSTATTTYGGIVDIRNNADYNTVKKSKILSLMNTSSSSYGVYMYYPNCDYTTIDSCYIKYGYYGIYNYMESGTYATNNTFSNNIIEDYYYYGIYNYYQNNATIDNNTITQISTSTGYNYALGQFYGVNPIITRNTIIDNNGTYTYGLRVYYAYNATNQWGIVANNMISLNGITGSAYAMYFYSNKNIKVFNNSVNITGGTITGTYATYFDGSTTYPGPYVLRNNSLVNKGGGYVYYMYEAIYTGGFTSSYNNLYKSASTTPLVRIISSPNVDCANLTAWQVYGPNDVVSMDGGYLSNTNLHSVGYQMNAAGTPLADVTIDIDGQARNATTPDIGCDEFEFLANDLSALGIWTMGDLAQDGGEGHVIAGRFINLGSDIQYNVPMTLNISGANTLSLTATVDTVIPFQEKIVYFPTYSLLNTGWNTLTLVCPSDMNNANNNIATHQNSTTNIMSYVDTLGMDGSIGVNDVDGHSWWTKFTTGGNYAISHMKLFIPNISANAGKTIYGAVMNASGTIVGQSDAYVIPGSALGQWVTIPFPNPTILVMNSTTFYLGIIQPASSAATPMSWQEENPMRPGTYYFSTNQSGSGLTAENMNRRWMMKVQYLEPFPFDLAVNQLVAPEGGCGMGDETVIFEVKNLGFDTITSFTISYQVVGSSNIVTETVTGVTILPFATYEHSFTTLYNFAAPTQDSTFQVVCTVSLAGDANASNDSYTGEVDSKFVPGNPIPFDAIVVISNPATLSVSSPYNVIWYDNAAGGQFIAFGDTFYTTPPLFDTTSYWASATTGAFGDFTIGTGATTYTGTVNNPYGQYYTSQQMQFLLTASYLTSLGMMPGQVNSLALNVQTPAGAALQNFSIKLGHTSLSTLDATAASWTSTGMQTVYSVASYTSVAGWNNHVFQTPFVWNGTSNLVVQFCFSNGTSNYTTNAYLYGDNTTAASSVGYYTDGTFDCDVPSYYYTSTFFPQMQINATVPGCESDLVEVVAYVIKPPFDAEVSEITSPVGGCGLGSETITVKVRNAGSDVITAIDMSYYVAGALAPVTEPVTNISLQPDSIMYYSFVAPYDFSVVGADSVFELSVWGTLLGDTTNGNDTTFLAFESNYVPASPIPYNTTVTFGSTATVSVSSPDNILWYDNPAGGQFIAIGDTFYTTPPLFDTTSYYAAATSGAQGDFYIASNATTYNGTTNNPYGQFYTSMQAQYLLTASYLNSLGVMPGQINSLSLNVQTPAGAALQNFSIALGHTTLTTLGTTAASWTSTGMQTVYTNPSYTSVSGWNLHEFATPFVWNGVDNLVIQFCFSNGTSNYTTNATLYGQTMSSPTSVGYYTDGTFNCNVPSYYYTSTFMPYMILNATVPGCETDLVEVIAYVTNIPTLDAGIASVVAPLSGVELCDEPIIVEIENLGATSITGFQITAVIDNTTNITNIVTDVIPAGGSILYTFATTANLCAFQTYNICIYTQLTGDQYSANDTICYTVTNDPLLYCTSTATSTGYEEIVNFGLGTFANYSGPAYGAMYTNFTSLGSIQTVYNGLTYPITVTSDFPPGYTYAYTCYAKLFIDWNHNGVYDVATETAWGGPMTSSTTVTGTIIVPITALPGTHGARLVFVETSAASGVTPCGTYSWGETEDYIITVGTPEPWDAGVTAITSPSGVLVEGNSANVVTTVFNLGLNTITSMDVSYTINGGAPFTIPFTGSLASLTSTSVTFPPFTLPGGFIDICAYTTLVNDSNTINDTTCITLYALPQFDLEMTALISPEDGCDLGNETVTVEFENLGDTITDGIILGYFNNVNTTPVTESYTDTIFPGDVITYTFTTPANMAVTVDTDFDFTAFLAYGPDPVATNDTIFTTVGSYLSPLAPSANGATIWSSEFTTLNVISPDTTMFYSWFASADTSLIDQGASFTTPQLFDTTVYLLGAAAGGGSGSVTTTYIGGNGQSGNMFNVTAVNGNITIESFDVSFTGTTTIDIYYKEGSYVGFEANAGAWTLMGSVSNVTGVGTGVGTNVAIGGLTVPYGQTYGIWVTTNNSSIVYTTLSAYETYTDGNLSIYSGVGVSLPLGSIFSPRGWNGTIYYSSGNGCVSELVPVTVNVQYAQYDGGVVDIISPASGPYLTSLPVSVILFNNGLNPISGFPVSYTIDGGNLVTQTCPDTIQPLDSLLFNFTAPAPFPIVDQTYQFCVEVGVPNDGYSLNDELCTPVVNMDGDGLTCPTAFPYGAVNNPSVNSYTDHAFDVEWWSFDVPYPMENIVVSLCGGTSFDTQLAIYDSCEAFSYSYYNDDYCGGPSQITMSGVIPAGTYYVKVYGWSSAFGTFNLNITGTTIAKFVVELTGINTSCFGSANGSITSALLPGSAGTSADLPVTYSWAPSGQTTANIAGLVAGTYSVTVTDATGWQESASITITQPADIAIAGVTVDNTVIGGNVGSIDITVTGGTSPYTYHWGNNTTTEDIANAYAGIYDVTVEDNNGCDQVATFPVNSPSPWTVTPTNIHHLIVIPQNALITLDALNLPAGSFVGVFYDSAGTQKCGGWAYWSGMATTLVAYGQTSGLDNGFAPNETFNWRVYKATTGEDYAGTATYNISMYLNNSTFQIGGLSGITKIEAFSIITQTIALPEGWSIWSTYINPTNPSIQVVMAEIAPCPPAVSKVVIVKNGAGQIFWPAYCLNMIGNVVIGQGYQVKVANNNLGASFGVVGLKLSPNTPFTIPTGWSLMAYLKDHTDLAVSMLAAIAPVNTTTGCTQIVKNGAGQIFWPAYNLITFPGGLLYPGQGYQIKYNCAPVLFSYPGTKSNDVSYNEISTPKHYIEVENTGNNMSLGIPQDAWTVEPMYGDEIGVYNAAGKLVGASVYEGGFTAVTIWGKEVINPEEKGSDGSVYSIRFWQVSSQTEMDIVVSEWSEGDDTYATDGIAVVAKLAVQGAFDDNFVLGQNMPNPFNTMTVIPFYVPVDCQVNLAIYNTLGEKIMDVFNQTVSAGKYE